MAEIRLKPLRNSLWQLLGSSLVVLSVVVFGPLGVPEPLELLLPLEGGLLKVPHRGAAGGHLGGGTIGGVSALSLHLREN